LHFPIDSSTSPKQILEISDFVLCKINLQFSNF
jgi:hypothetical protein